MNEITCISPIDGKVFATRNTLSLKDAKGAVLLSPKGGEATGVVKAAIENFQKNSPNIKSILSISFNSFKKYGFK